jgi:hypothetical protein
MKRLHDTKSKNDTILIVVLIDVIGILFLLFTDAISGYWTLLGIMLFIFSSIVAMLGRDRKIGVLGAYALSLLLSPLIGLIITLSSTKFSDEEYQEKMLDIAENKAAASSIADQLYKLNELRIQGVLTDEEFTMQKERLLNS